MHAFFNQVFLATFLAASPGTATGQDAPQPAQPDHEYFVGQWDCAGFAVDPHTGKRSDIVGTWRSHPWDNHWSTDVFESYTNTGAHYVEWGWTHYDRLSKTYSRNVTNNLGGHARYATPGWDGTTWTWNGEAGGLTTAGVAVTQTVTSKHAGHFWITVRYTDADQKGHDLYKADCHRKGAEQRLVQ